MKKVYIVVTEGNKAFVFEQREEAEDFLNSIRGDWMNPVVARDGKTMPDRVDPKGLLFERDIL